MRWQRSASLVLVASGSLAWTMGCGKIRSLAQREKAETPDAASTAPPAESAHERLADSAAVCQVEAKKVWAKSVNRRSGITATRLGERVAVGVALGNQPHLLVIEGSGEGKLVALPAAAGSPLSKDLPAAQGVRDLQRVTPAIIGGKLSAYADYRDNYKNDRRRVACGPAQGTDTLIVFDGAPLLDGKKPNPLLDAGAPAASASVPPKPPAAPAPAAAQDAALPTDAGTPAPPGSASKIRGVLDSMLKARVAKSGVPDASAARPPVVSREAGDAGAPAALSELRDCRSFVGSDGKGGWALGSELRAESAAGKLTWTMRLVAVPAPGAAPQVLHTVRLPAQPKEIQNFDAPAAEQLRDGSFALTVRSRGQLYAWQLNANKQVTRGPQVYASGYPTLGHFVPDGMDYLFLTSQQTEGERFGVRFARLDVHSPRFPAELERAGVSGAHSYAEPSLARAGKQRWLSYHAGERREGQLVIVPVDHSLAALGQPYAVTEGERTVYESLLLSLAGERLLAVFLQNSDSGAELVSEVLNCSVQKR